LGLEDVFSLVMHLPIRYIDETIVTPIRDIQMGVLSQIEAEVVRAEIAYKPKKMLIVQVKDASSSLQLRFLQSLTYPRTSTSSLPFIPPAIAKIKCGSLLGNDPLCVVLTNYSVKFPTDVPWSETSYVPYKFEVDLSFVVVYDSGNLPGAERIITLGN